MGKKGIGICLSGGGYRAALFHAGALRRLNELGVLAHPQLDTITSVSGGSITSACLATAASWPLAAPLTPDQWEQSFEARLRALTQRNIRTISFLKSFLPGRSTVGEIAKQYDRFLDTKTPLADLPAPFVICATDLAFGANWEFKRGRMGSYKAGYVPVPPGWTLGRAVAASSCFPPVFQPVPIPRDVGEWKGGLESGEAWEAGMKDLRLSDGGVYDNLGLEPVWSSDDDASGGYAFVFVSDAGGLFGAAPDSGLPARVKRYQAIQENQMRALRKRWLISRYKKGALGGAYWGIGNARRDFDANDSTGYSKEFAKGVIARIRTDLDRFSDAEAAVLQNHGYLLADVAVHTHSQALLTRPAASLTPPFPAWLPDRKSEGELRDALKDSDKRTNLGRH